MSKTPEQVAIQIAVEAVINDPGAFDVADRAAVLKVGTDAGVADLYLDMLRYRVTCEFPGCT